MTTVVGKGWPVPENMVRDLLSKYAIPFPDFIVLSPEESPQDIALSFPVVLKVCSAEILHKIDVGGVRLNITDHNELEKALKNLLHL